MFHFKLATSLILRHARGMKRSLLLLPLLLTQCGDEPKKADAAPPAKAVAEEKPKTADAKPAAAAPAPDKTEPKKVYWTQEMMHTEIKYHNPGYEGNAQFNIEGGNVIALSLRGAKIENVKFLQHIEPLALDLSETSITDLRPMQGKKLVELYLEDTKVRDLSPIRGMPLEKLYLSRTPVENLSALEGMPLVELNAVGCPIGDISGIAHCPIQMLWLTDCPVENIGALKTVPLVSVTCTEPSRPRTTFSMSLKAFFSAASAANAAPIAAASCADMKSKGVRPSTSSGA